jgi:molecular chaperone DnaK (HSP70)
MGNSDTLSPCERRIIVGIDFGTTYSGLAWAETRRVRIITSVTKQAIYHVVDSLITYK